MAAGFRTRRIKSEYSIGDRLKRARIRRKISVADVEEATKIRAKFILALESDSWEQIPSEVYGRGYLEAYAEFLRLPTEQIMREYDKFRPMYARLCQQGKVEITPRQAFQVPRFVLTPRFVMIGALSIAFVALSGVVVRQFRTYAAAPFLALTMPAEAHAGDGSQVIVETSSVRITGKTAIGAAVSVNGQPVPVTEEGAFEASVQLQKGVNAVMVEAKTVNGKVSKEIRTIIVK